MKKLPSVVFYIIDILLMAGLTFLDQYTKGLVVERLKEQAPYSIAGDFFTFRYLENKGAAFSILQNQRVFFLIVGTVFCLVIIAALIYIPTYGKYHALRLCLVFLFSGALGNMIDRYMNSYVVDFISVGTFPVFNVADIYVTVSTAALVILVLFVFKEDELNFKAVRTPKIHSSMVYRNDSASDKSEDISFKEDKAGEKKPEKEEDKEETDASK
ncbi:MAG: signal peptidase II [Lachnospiraceae bacterium]|nr:signal peptidase II [Lachnospiraceae bacterium]